MQTLFSHRFLLAFLLLSSLAVHHRAYGQIPRTLSYQAILTDNAGTPKPDGPYTVTFRLYAAAGGGASLWTESQVLQVKNGLFSAVLGGVTPLGPTLTFTQPYWLSLQVAPEPELSSRLPLTAAGYALGPWSPSTSSSVQGIVYGGNVGIGSTAPVGKLEVVGQDALRLIGFQPFLTLFDDNAGYARGRIQSVGGDVNIFSESYLSGANPFSFVKLANNGNVGIGSATPVGKLEVVGQDAIRLIGYQPFLTLFDDNAGYARGRIQSVGGAIILEPESFVNGSNPNAHVTISSAGDVSLKNLTLRGGADLAEPFGTAAQGIVEPGSIMIIDAANPGKLRISEQPYDTRVAGIVSCAGGVYPGITLQQEGMLEGKSLVALAGRVYCRAEANGAPIEPGDLLTTSTIPGHAMKATDRDRSHGSIIGKAMTGLKEGTGLVLVLVNLQ